MRICQKCGTIFKNSTKNPICPINGCDGGIIKVDKSIAFLLEILLHKNYLVKGINADMPHYSPDVVTSLENPSLRISLDNIPVGEISRTGCATVSFAVKPFLVLDDAGEEATRKIGNIFYRTDNPSLIEGEKSLLENIINHLCLNDMPLFGGINMISVSLVSTNGVAITQITIVFQNLFTYYSGIADLKLNKYHAFLNYDYLCKKAFLDVVQALPQIQ